MAKSKKISKAKTAKKAITRKASAAKANKPRQAKIRRLPKEVLKKYKILLLKERKLVGGDISHIAENTLNKSSREATGDLSGYAYHMADQASDDYDRDFSLERASAEQKIMFFIDEALKRIEEGTYGSCLSCGRQIAKKRLVALPHSEYCIECQKNTENR